MVVGPGKTRVAVVGASGIGKHHAKWWALNGADVCAFAGSSSATVRKTGAALRDLFGFQGRGYTDITSMLAELNPDIVDVCSPPELHASHCRAALDAGAHVLCEKPFVFDATRRHDELLAEANALMNRAARSDLCLGVCTQYSVGARWFADLWRKSAPNESLRTFEGHLESPARGRVPDPGRIWLDLSPHPLSMLLELVPGCAVDWSSLAVQFAGYEATARFRVRDVSDQVVECTIITRNSVEPPGHVRRCVLNGWETRVEGYTPEDGVYRSKLVTPAGAVEREDLLCAIVRDFGIGIAPTSPQSAIQNLDMMLGILGKMRGGRLGRQSEPTARGTARGDSEDYVERTV